MEPKGAQQPRKTQNVKKYDKNGKAANMLSPGNQM